MSFTRETAMARALCIGSFTRETPVAHALGRPKFHA